MVWKYSKTMKRIGEEVVSEAQAADGEKKEGKWNFYETTSQEYKDGFRIWWKFEAEVTHTEF